MSIAEASIFRSPFGTPLIYRSPFRPRPAYTQLHRHWLWSPLGQRHFIDLIRRRVPSAFWPQQTIEAVVDAVGQVLIADVRARLRKGGAS